MKRKIEINIFRSRNIESKHNNIDDFAVQISCFENDDDTKTMQVYNAKDWERIDTIKYEIEDGD